ncbi:MAG: hypothetical protein ACTHQM_05620 [Thermoanaerobaculia bacterium]
MSAHLTKAVCFAVMLFVACGKKTPADPFSTEAIQKDLDERPVRALYEEFGKQPQYAPPVDGLLTDAQIEMFANVTKLAVRIARISNGELDDKIESARRDDDRYSRMATTFSAIGDVRNVATAEIRATTTLHVNPHEYDWVLREVHRAAGIAARQREAEAKIRVAEKAYYAETNDYLRSQREQELATERQNLSWIVRDLGDAERANAALVKKHAEALAPYVTSLRER